MDHPDETMPNALEQDREPALLEMVAETFRRGPRWLITVVWLYILLFGALTFVAAVRFFQVESTRAMIAWASIFVAALLITVVTKLWYWMLMNRNVVTGAIERLERRLAEKGSDPASGER